MSSGLKALLNPAIKKIAIANPQHAPYGKAAVAAMQQENVYDKVKDKLVLGETFRRRPPSLFPARQTLGSVHYLWRSHPT